METTTAWRLLVDADLRQRLSVPVIDAAGALEPRISGRLLLALEDGVLDTLETIADAVRPRFVALTPAYDDGFSVLLVGDIWVAIDLQTREWLDDTGPIEGTPLDDGGDEEDEAGTYRVPTPFEDIDDELRTAFNDAVADLTTTTTVGHHGKAKEAHRAIQEWARANRPALADRVDTPVAHHRLWEFANRLQSSLRDAHSTAMRRDARTWAEHIADQETLTAAASKTVLREAAYRGMRQVDEVCATRIATEAIADELAVVLRERTPRI